MITSKEKLQWSIFQTDSMTNILFIPNIIAKPTEIKLQRVASSSKLLSASFFSSKTSKDQHWIHFSFLSRAHLKTLFGV